MIFWIDIQFLSSCWLRRATLQILNINYTKFREKPRTAGTRKTPPGVSRGERWFSAIAMRHYDPHGDQIRHDISWGGGGGGGHKQRRPELRPWVMGVELGLHDEERLGKALLDVAKDSALFKLHKKVV